MMARTEEQRAARRVYESTRREYLNERLRQYRANNPDKARDIQRRCYEKHKEARLASQKLYNATPAAKEKKRSNHLRKIYGISLDKYNQLLDEQGGVCAICKQKERDGRRPYLSVDHEHETGSVRGLLCISCNSALGLLAEDRDRILSLLAYIGRHNVTEEG